MKCTNCKKDFKHLVIDSDGDWCTACNEKRKATTTDHDFIRRIDGERNEARFYQGVKAATDKTEEKVLWTYPSVTSKLGEAYPSGYYLEKYMRDNGEHGRVEFTKAADRGTEVHVAIEKLLNGHAVPTELMEARVKKGIQAFLDWYNEVHPEVIATEHIVVNHKYKYAGTADLICKIDYKDGKKHYEGVYLVDYKTSRSIWQTHKLQCAAYAMASDEKIDKIACLHLGNTTKKKYSFLDYDIEDYWEEYKHFNKTFEILHPNAKPKNIEYPDIFIIPELQTNPGALLTPIEDATKDDVPKK